VPPVELAALLKVQAPVAAFANHDEASTWQRFPPVEVE